MQRFTGVCVLLGLTFSSVSGLGLRTPKQSEPSNQQPEDVFPGTGYAVPEKPTVKLPEHHLHEVQKTEVECQALDACLSEHSGKGEEKALKTCVVKHLGQEKGEKVWSIYSKAKLDPTKKISLAAFKVSQPASYFKVLSVLIEGSGHEGVLLQSDFCAAPETPKKNAVEVAAEQAMTVTLVPVPQVTDVELPQPGENHPQHPADGKNAVATPPTCQKLDACLGKAGKDTYEKDFEKCVSDFCKESYKANDFKGEDDPRTQLCDKKGKDAWDLMAKAGAEVKKTSSLLGLKSVVTTSSLVHDADVYRHIMESVFPKGLTLVEMQQKCQL